MKVTQTCPTLCDPWTIQSRVLELVTFPFSRISSQPGIEPRSPTLQADSLPSEPPGKHMNTGAHNLSLLQGMFPTQGLNLGILHCRQLLYHVSHQGSQLVSPCLCLGAMVTTGDLDERDEVHSLPWAFGFPQVIE